MIREMEARRQAFEDEVCALMAQMGYREMHIDPTIKSVALDALVMRFQGPKDEEIEVAITGRDLRTNQHLNEIRQVAGNRVRAVLTDRMHAIEDDGA